MILLKRWRRLILGLSLTELFFLGLDSLAIASPKFNLNKTAPLIIASEEPNSQEQYRLLQTLETIERMDDSQVKVILLNDLALSHAKLGDIEKAIAILEQSLSITRHFDDIALKITTLTEIAKSYAQINQKERANKILDDTVELVREVKDKTLQGQFLLGISLNYGEIGQEESARALFAQSQAVIAEASQPQLKFPFTETPSTFKLGFSATVNSFRDTTALVGIDVDFSKQWSEDDIFVDSNIYLSYDSSRSDNNYRPGSSIAAVYRHHFDPNWNFFADFYNRTNQDLYSSKNDDEDLTIISGLYLGAGLNLWQGDSPSDFLDFQLGIGPRYEYDYIDFEQKRNQIVPVLAVILLGRGFSLGEARLNQTFAVLPALIDFENYIISSDTNFSVPLSERWSFTNRLFIRYRNQLILEGNPKLEFFFSTGLEYTF
jgi:hypothetical protein